MAFFRNRTVNLLNLHYGIHCLAIYGGGAFLLVFLLRAGLSAPWVLVSLALVLTGRFIVRPVIVPIGARIGMRRLLVLGTLLSAVQYPLLAEVQGIGPWLFAWIAAAAIGDTFYWSSYHAYFAAIGDAEHRGAQLGIREAMVSVLGIVSPLAAGWVLVTHGPHWAFGITALFLAAAALPLLWTPDVAVARRAPGAYRAALPGMKLFLADGWIGAGYHFVWQIVLFVSLGESYIAFGGALAIAALVGAVAGLVLGRLIDLGHGARAVWLAFAALTFTVLVRAASPGDPTLALFANAMGALVNCLYIPTLMTAVYNLAKRAPCTLRFHVAAEGAWDVGNTACCLITAALVWAGAPLNTGLLLSLIGVALLFTLLRKYYAEHPNVHIAASEPVVEGPLSPQP